jgi:hypothetical protein
VRRRGWAYYKTAISRSPRVETLNSAHRTPLSILHHAKGTEVHAQFRELTLEVLGDLGISDRLDLVARPRRRPPTSLGRARARGGPPRAARRGALGARRLEKVGAMSTFGIAVGGGPAPGINGVIGAAATRALRRGTA